MTLDYQYDAAGRRTQMAAAIDGTADFVDDYTYDGLGRVVSVAEHGVSGGNAVAAKEIDLAYNDAGQLLSLDRYESGQLAVEGDYSYDSLGRLVGLIYHQGDTVLNSYAWTYSGDSSVANASPLAPWSPTGGLMPVHDTSGITDALMSGGLSGLSLLTSVTSNDGTATYSYDPTGELIAVSRTGGQSDEAYSYDANGNRVTANGSTYTTGADNRLISDGTYTYSYDAEGNRVAKFIDTNTDGVLDTGDTDITQYAWDNRNRLIEVTNRAVFGGDPTQIVQYRYDPENRLVGEGIDDNGDGVVDRQFCFAYDGNQIILEFDKQGSGAVTGQNVRDRLLWQPNAVDQLMAEERTHLNTYSNIVTDEVLWALTDQQGTVHDLAKRYATTGATAVVDHIIYNSFGKVMSESNPTEGSPFKYNGRFTDPWTDIEFHDQRVKPAGSPVWMQKDPSGLSADVNPYRVCRNNPTNLTDPTGLVGLPTDTDSPTRAIWDAIRRGAWDEARDLIGDWINCFPEGSREYKILKGLTQAIKQMENLDKWRKQMSKLPLSDLKAMLKTLEKTLAEHLKVRGGIDTPETLRLRYQIDFLKKLLGL